MPVTRDPYELLGLERGADLPEIKRAYRRLAKRYHPDTVQGDARLFVALRGAYDTLIDPHRRFEWDRRHPSSGRRANGDPDRPIGATGSRVARAAAAGGVPRGYGSWGVRDARGRFVRPEARPWWEEIRGEHRVGLDLPGSRGDPHLGPSSSGAAWSMAARAYHRRLTRQDSGSPERRAADRGRQPLS